MRSKVIPFIAFLIVVWLCLMENFANSHYSLLASCADVNYTTGIATFVDNSGNEWEWELNLDSWFIKKGNVYRLCMNNSHTETIADDFIRKIKED